MRMPIASAVLAALVVLTWIVGRTTPASAQDFSITNTVTPEAPMDPGRRDVLRQLQAWWDVHAYYPRDASQSDQGGTVEVHLVIHPDGNVWTASMVGSSGSPVLDTAGAAVFRGGFVRPLPAGAPETELDVSLHYVLAHRHDQPVVAGNTPALSRNPFTISNDPVTATVVGTMLQRTCTGIVVEHGLRNHPAYGSRNAATAIFFRKPDGTPWVKLSERGYISYSPVTEVGRVAQWAGPIQHFGMNGADIYTHYSVWPDGDNHLIGDISYPQGTVDLTCASDVVPAITSNAFLDNPGASRTCPPDRSVQGCLPP